MNRDRELYIAHRYLRYQLLQRTADANPFVWVRGSSRSLVKCRLCGYAMGPTKRVSHAVWHFKKVPAAARAAAAARQYELAYEIHHGGA